MQWFHDLKIATKLLVSFVAVLALTALLGIFAIAGMERVNRGATDLSGKWLPSVQAILMLKSDMQEFRVLELQHTLSSDEAGMTRYEALMADTLSTFKKHNQDYAKLIFEPEERATYLEFNKLWADYLTEHAKIVGLSRQGRSYDAKTMTRGDSARLLVKLTERINKLVRVNVDGGNKATKAAGEIFSSSRFWIVGLLAGAIVFGLALALWVADLVARPLRAAVNVAKQVASGDLSAEIIVGSKDETGQLLQALKQMNANLLKIVDEVRSGTDAMADVSSQIAAGNLDLSSRTKEQANSLEETAASMEELTSTVRQNADNARQANQLSISASGMAVKGGDVVSQVVETMGSINASSKKIVDIISVIDGIAFQTNILALNAAVEAARAGEQGRGFAVVATEVRNLAQRSAAAAREIKELIGDSVGKVEAGSRLVEQAGSTMNEVVASVKRVTDIMGEIMAASQEQSSGIEQVHQAISQMDQVTQQNAALVEEAAAAAGSLQEQAVNLAQVVAVFKLTHG